MEHSAILLTFIKLPFSVETFVLSIFNWLFKTGFTVSGLSMVRVTRPHRLGGNRKCYQQSATTDQK